MLNKQEISDFVYSLTKDEFKDLQNVVNLRISKEKYGAVTLTEYGQNFNRKIVCPYCNSTDYFKNGFTPDNKQRYVCRKCNRTFTLLSNSVFKSTKLSLLQWMNFLILMSYNVPLDVIAESINISHESAFLLRYKVFSTVDKYQDKIVLSKKVWVDETFIRDTVENKDYRQVGLSKEQICIVVGIDCYKNIVAFVTGKGKINSERFTNALINHVKKESTIVHDGEASHNKLIKLLNCKEEFHKASVKDEEYKESMNLINSFCSWLQRYLYKFLGMKKENLQSYLNWYVYLYRIKQQNEKYPKIERLIRHLLLHNGKFTRMDL